ncbi:MAG: hypothetical protein HOO96_31430 [Polyangiaceae bacterium]|nr:hypothetical protein [Polyangiaceae bacterium]
MIPSAFQTRGLLRNLNVLAVGAGLASVTGAIFSLIFSSGSDAVRLGISTTLPTLVLGMVWAMLLRWRKTVGASALRWGWLASIPLAALNGGLAAVGLFWNGNTSLLEAVGMGVLLGSTIGAIFWVPGLIATLVCFGIPLAWGQRLAAKGLAGEERGELLVGAVSALVGILGVLIAAVAPPPHFFDPSEAWGLSAVRVLIEAVGAVAALAGGAAALVSLLRAERRRTFVRNVEAGTVPGYRVEESHEGKVLIRVNAQMPGYRVADFHEEVYALDEAGEAKRALQIPPRGS